MDGRFCKEDKKEHTCLEKGWDFCCNKSKIGQKHKYAKRHQTFLGMEPPYHTYHTIPYHIYAAGGDATATHKNDTKFECEPQTPLIVLAHAFLQASSLC